MKTILTQYNSLMKDIRSMQVIRAKSLEVSGIKSILQAEAERKALMSFPAVDTIKEMKAQALRISSEFNFIQQQQANLQKMLKSPFEDLLKNIILPKPFITTGLSKETQAMLKIINHRSLYESLQRIEQLSQLVELTEGDIQETTQQEGHFAPATELVEAAFSSDKEAINQFKPTQIKAFLIWCLAFALPYLCTITGYTLKDFIEMKQPLTKEEICQTYQIDNAENAEIRQVHLTNGTLNIRQYPKEKGQVLAELPNGELICLPNKQKGNQRWLKVRIKDENDELITGYVNARFTKKVTIINGERF